MREPLAETGTAASWNLSGRVLVVEQGVGVDCGAGAAEVRAAAATRSAVKVDMVGGRERASILDAATRLPCGLCRQQETVSVS